MTLRFGRGTAPLLATSVVLLACGINDAEPEGDAGPPGAGTGSSVVARATGLAGASGTDGAGGRAGDSAPGPLARCPTGYQCTQLATLPPNKLDLLFMVDNSKSMAGEQASLRRAFPRLFTTLTGGEGGPSSLTDLHVGVVSSDMGIPGVNFPPCSADGGDDGRLQHTPRGEGCDATDPAFEPHFLSFDSTGSQVIDKLASDVGCIATLGTDGCGFEQQLEAPFKALWPSVYIDANGEVVTPNPYRFLATSEPGVWGRGDVPVAQGGNAGFLRSPLTDESLIAVVVVTDEEDCSVTNTDHLRPDDQLPDDSPYRNEDLDLRCYLHPEFLYDVQNRYYRGFTALRPGREELVVFGAIAGIPPELVTREVLDGVDFTAAASRARFYDSILNDDRMQYAPDDQAGTGQGNLKPACDRAVEGETLQSTAYPARRIVELAQHFGENGIVQSICQDDFGPAVDAIATTIGRQLKPSCLDEAKPRGDDGTIPCHVVWELPAVTPNPAVPTRCDALAFLEPVYEGRTQTNVLGGENCQVKQLAVAGDSTAAPEGDGWYYDDASEELSVSCGREGAQRIVFTPNALPDPSVKVWLECKRD
ncbi:MAG: hypothetical protein ABW321_05080 [Polyangiales bacterium]